MCVPKTGFWCAPDIDGVDFHLYWARWNGSDKRSQLWELSVKVDGENSLYRWTDVSARFREYGFQGYLGALKFQGYTVAQQPNGYTRNLTEMPRLPYPAGMLAGSEDMSDGWTYTPAVAEDPGADTVAVTRPAVWTIRVADVPAGSDDDVQGLPLPGLDDDFFTPRDIVAIDDDYEDVWDDETSPTAAEIAEYEADVLTVQAADVAADDGGVVDAEPEPVKAEPRKKTKTAAKPKPRKKAKPRKAKSRKTVREPEPVTAEIPEIPPKTNDKAVSYATIPTGVTAKDFQPLQGLGFIYWVRSSGERPRKVAYIAADEKRCVIAYRDRYTPGSDKTVEDALRARALKLGFDLGKAA